MGIAVLVIGVAIVAVRFIPNEVELGDPEAGVPEKRPWRERLRENLSVWADWRLILIGVVMLGMAFAEGSANDWLALGVVDGHHQSNATGALVFGFFVAAMTVGRVLGGPLVDRIGRTNSIRLTAGLGVLGLLLFILGGPLWLVVVGTVLWGFGVSLGFPLGMSAAADGTDKPAARVSAVAMIGYCAFLVGPPLIGFLGQAFGILNALFVLLVLMVASALAAPAVREASRTRQPRVSADA
jgi:MFS family permease